MTIGSEIRKRRKSLKWTLEELAHRAGTDTGNLSRLERDKQGYSAEMIESIAIALGCTVADLFLQGQSNVEPTHPGMRRIPLISFVQAGNMTEAADPYVVGDAADWILTDLDLSRNSFALKIRGDSMAPEFKEGDVIIIDPHVEPLPGDYVVAKNSHEEATFKKYRPRGLNERGDRVFELVPINEDYESIRSDLTSIRIIGTLIEHRRYPKK